jgi:hypothetical protein
MDSVPPKISSASSSTRVVAVILAGAALLAGVTLYFFNPSTHGFYPVCQFHQLTGLNCPGCGMTRAAYALLHGDFAAALHDNALFVGLIVFFGLRGGLFALNKQRGKANGQFFPAKLLWSLLVIAVLFTILRNLPGFEILAP